MKFRKPGQILLAVAVSAGIGFGLTSCSASNTVDFVYVTASKNNPGQISVYELDVESGALSPIQDSPYPSGGRNPVADLASPNGLNLYVLNHDDNNIVQFAIGTDGKLYPQHTCNTPGTEPVALAMNANATQLFVVDYYAPGFSDQNPGPGAVISYPLNTDGSIGTGGSPSCTPIANGNLSYWAVGNNPSGVNVTANGSFVFVTNSNSTLNCSTTSPSCGPSNTGTGATGTQLGTVSAFQIASSGALTPVAGSPFQAGTTPSAIASDPTSRFLYVTDSSQNQLIGYDILSTGVLQPINSGPFRTGVFPDSVTVDPRGQYIYVANYTDGSISSYSIDQSTGAPSATSGGGTFSTGGAGPTSVLIDPAFGRFVMTSNFLDNTVGGLTLNPSTGALTTNQNSPYPSAGQPTSIAAIPHGNHPAEHVQATAGQ